MRRSADALVLGCVLGGLLVLNVLLFGRAARVARRTEIVPVPSSYRATASGCRALYELLGRLEVNVGRWTAPLTQPLPPTVTVLVLLEPVYYVTPVEALALRQWVDRGGTLVVAVEGAPSRTSPARELAGTLFLRDPEVGRRQVQQLRRQGWPERWAGVQRWEIRDGSRYTVGIHAVELDPAASKMPSPEALSLAAAELTDSRRAWPLAADAPDLGSVTVLGQGRILFLPTPALLANGQLGRADNAVFAVNLLTAHAAGGRVVFEEYHLGNVGADSLWSVLQRPPQLFVVLQLGLALAVLLLRAAMRQGPARPDESGPPRRPAADFVRGLAVLYRRAGANGVVAGLWSDATRRELARLAGVKPTVTVERLARRVQRPEVGALLARLEAARGGASDTELLSAAQAADDLVRGVAARGKDNRPGDEPESA